MLDKIFFILQRRYLHSLPPGLNEACKNQLSKCLACISSLHPQYMDKSWEGCNNEDLLLYFTFLAECFINNSEDCHDLFIEKFKNEVTINFILKLLSQSELSPFWLGMMKFVVEQTENGVIVPFMPRFEMIPENPALYSGFYDLYKGIALGPDDIGFDIDRDFPIVQGLLIILTKIVDKLIEENDDQAIQFSSLAWSEIIDYGKEFFEYCDDDFLRPLLEKYFVALKFLVEDPSEFIEVVENSIDNIVDIVSGNNNYFPIILQFLNTIIYAVDSNYDDYINNESNRRSLEINVYYMLERFPVPPLFEFFSKKIEEISNGVIFVIAASPKEVNSHFAPMVTYQILHSDPIPPMALHFIRLCDISSCQDQIIQIITLAYSAFMQNPSVIAIQSICQLTLHQPKIFFDNTDKFINPLISWLQASPPPALPYIMECLLNLLSKINPAETKIGDILNLISKVVCDQIAALLQVDPQQMFDFLFEFVYRINSIIENFQKENENFKKEKQIVMPFFFQLYSQIVAVLGPLWHMPSEQVMDCLCKFLIKALHADIILDLNSVIKWVGEALAIQPVQEHFKLLDEETILYKILNENFENLPLEPVIGFMVSFPEIEYADLQNVVYKFIYKLLRKRWQYFPLFFPINLIISPIMSNDNRLVETAINLVSEVISSSWYQDSIGQVITMVINGMFTNFQENSIRNSVDIIIHALPTNKISVEQILQIVSQHLRFESREAIEFREALTSDIFNERRLIKAVKKMVRLHHTPENREVPHG